MVKIRNNKENSNINNGVGDNSFKLIETVKTYKWCDRCGKQLPEGSLIPFCDFECQSSFYREIAHETDCVVREIMGRD